MAIHFSRRLFPSLISLSLVISLMVMMGTMRSKPGRSSVARQAVPSSRVTSKPSSASIASTISPPSLGSCPSQPPQKMSAFFIGPSIGCQRRLGQRGRARAGCRHLDHPAFRAGGVSTAFIPEHPEVIPPAGDVPAAPDDAAPQPAREVTAEVNGRRFPGAVHTLDELLSGEPDLIRLSPGRYLSSHAIPDWVHSVPEPLLPVTTGADEDVLIALDALPEGLRAAVLDPIYEDVASGARFEPSGEERDLAEYPLLHHHFVMGTMAIRTIDRPLFASEPPLSLVVMRYGDTEAYPVWLNAKIGLLFGLSRWYHRHLPPSGAVFRIRHGEAAESYVLDYDGEVDTALAPADARIAVLERKRERVAHRPIATRDLMLELLDEHDAGLSFNALWAEMNAVRRTSRWQIASLLAYHACFSESDGRWMGDRALMGEPGDPTLAEAIVEA